jgi:hypothetical protein
MSRLLGSYTIVGDKLLATCEDGEVRPFKQLLVPYYDKDTQTLVVVGSSTYIFGTKLAATDGLVVVDDTAYIIDGLTLKAFVTAPQRKLCDRSPSCVDASTFVGGIDRMITDRVYPIDVESLGPDHLSLLARVHGMPADLLAELGLAFRVPDTSFQETVREAVIAFLDAMHIYKHHFKVGSDQLCADIPSFECPWLANGLRERRAQVTTTAQSQPPACPELDFKAVDAVRQQLLQVLEGKLPVTPVHKLYLRQGAVAGFSTAYAYACEHVPRNRALHLALAAICHW